MLSPIEGGPAARAGIISGDELVQIDGKESLPYSLWSLFEAMVTTSF